MRKLRGFFQNIALILFGLFFAFILGEVALRVVPNSIGYVDNGLIRIPWFIAEHDFDPDIGFWPKPNQKFRRRSDCYDVKEVNLNSLGMRSNWEPTRYSGVGIDKKIRIAVLGDSFAQALQVSDNEHFSAVLEQLLPNAEVLNFGVSSTGTVQQLVVYRKKVVPLEPNVVIHLVFLGNDIFDNNSALGTCFTGRDMGAERPYYDENGELTKPTKLVPIRYYNDGSSISKRAHNFLTSYSFIYNALLTLKRNSTSGDATIESKAPCQSWPYVRELVPLGALISPPDEYWKNAWRDTFRAILEIKKEVESRGQKYLLVTIPEIHSNYELYFKISKERNRGNEFERSRFNSQYPLQRFDEFASSNNIKYLSLNDGFREYSENFSSDVDFKKNYFSFSCDAHFNPLGHYLAAHLTAKSLYENGLLELKNIDIHPQLDHILSGLRKSPHDILGPEAFNAIYKQ